MEGRSDRFTAIEEQYAGYTVYDPDGDKIGKVDDLLLARDPLDPDTVGDGRGARGR